MELIEESQVRQPKKRFDLRYDKAAGLLLISPWLVGLLLFKIFPIIGSLGISFTDFHLLNPQDTVFVGLANYARLMEDVVVYPFHYIGNGYRHGPATGGRGNISRKPAEQPQIEGAHPAADTFLPAKHHSKHCYFFHVARICRSKYGMVKQVLS